RWNGVRSGESSSCTARSAGYERAALGESDPSSRASMRSLKRLAEAVAGIGGLSQAARRRRGGRCGGGARRPCARSAAQRLEARRANVDLVEQEVARERGRADRVEQPVDPPVGKRRA